MERVNPNLIVILHYVSKTSWLLLASLFGFLGFRLYEIGITQISSGQFSAAGLLTLSVHDAGPGLIVMIFALGASVVGAARSKVEFSDSGFSLSSPLRPGESGEEVKVPKDIPSGDDDLLPADGQCRLSSSIIEALAARAGRAFSIVDTSGKISFVSASWVSVPYRIRDVAIRDMLRRALVSTQPTRWSGRINEWDLEWILITNQGRSWYLLSLYTNDSALRRELVRQDTAPLVYEKDA